MVKVLKKIGLLLFFVIIMGGITCLIESDLFLLKIIFSNFLLACYAMSFLVFFLTRESTFKGIIPKWSHSDGFVQTNYYEETTSAEDTANFRNMIISLVLLAILIGNIILSICVFNENIMNLELEIHRIIFAFFSLFTFLSII